MHPLVDGQPGPGDCWEALAERSLTHDNLPVSDLPGRRWARTGGNLAKLFLAWAAGSLVVFAIVVAAGLGAPSAPHSPTVYVPAAFCPAGQHVAGMRDGMPVCVTPPSPKPTGLGVTP